MSAKSKPRSDEVELSLFGPGIGECIVIHIGDGRWIVIDSCLDSSKAPIAKTYLEEIGVDLSTQVDLVVITHWHDDHIGGISELVSQCKSAKIACSLALRNQQFGRLVAIDDEITLHKECSGVREFANIWKAIESKRVSSNSIVWTHQDHVLLKTATSTVTSLSPSSSTLTASFKELAKHLPQKQSEIRGVKNPSPNSTSVVIHIESHGFNLALGADMENHPDSKRGWNGIFNATTFPSTRSDVFKISHHGSENGDDPRIWSSLVQQSAIGVLTPYARGQKKLPAQQDIDRLKATSRQIYSTVWPLTVAPPRRRGADKTISEVAKSRRAMRKQPGHVRVRLSQGSSLSINLFGGAAAL